MSQTVYIVENPYIATFTKIIFTDENYYIEVLNGFFYRNTILSLLLRKIHIVDVFKFINLRMILNLIYILESFNSEKIEKFDDFRDKYVLTDTLYLLLENLIIFGYSCFYIKLINEK